MRIQLNIIAVGLIITLALGCWERKIEKVTMMRLAQAVEPQVDVLLPDNLNAGIKCDSYGPGCQGAFKAKVRLVELILVEFENTAQAQEAARKYDQWYANNWMFDDVSGEAVLEDFIQRAFQAKRARRN